MSVINRHPVMSYLIAAAGVVLAGLSPWWLTPLTGDTPPMRLMLVVVVGVSAWLGGLGPGLFGHGAGARWRSSSPMTHRETGRTLTYEARPVRLAGLCCSRCYSRGCMPPGAGPRSRNKNIAAAKAATAV